MNNRDAVAELGRYLGLPELALDRDDGCDIVVSDNAEITFSGRPDDTTMRLTALVADLAGLERLALQLLELNASPQHTRGAAFAVEHRTAEIVLVREIDLSAMTFEGFLAALEAFAALAIGWIAQLPQMAPADETPGLAGADPTREVLFKP